MEARVPDAPVNFERVDVPGNVRLTVLAEAAGVSVEALAALNPSLVARRTPRDAEVWPLRLTRGNRASSGLTTVAAGGDDTHRLVTLRVGEDLAALADRVGAPERVLRAINGWDYGSLIPYGTEVMVPERYRERAAPAEEEERVLVLPASPIVPADQRLVYYTTTPIDRPAVLASAFGVSVWDLCAWNDLDLTPRSLQALSYGCGSLPSAT